MESEGKTINKIIVNDLLTYKINWLQNFACPALIIEFYSVYVYLSALTGFEVLQWSASILGRLHSTHSSMVTPVPKNDNNLRDLLSDQHTIYYVACWSNSLMLRFCHFNPSIFSYILRHVGVRCCLEFIVLSWLIVTPRTRRANGTLRSPPLINVRIPLR